MVTEQGICLLFTEFLLDLGSLVQTQSKCHQGLSSDLKTAVRQGDAGGHGPALLAEPPGHKARAGPQEQGPAGRQQPAAGAQGRAREQRGSAAARARSPPTPTSRSLLLRALSVTPAVPSPGPLRPSPSSRRARGQGIGLVTSSTAALSTEWTPPRPDSPRHRPRPRAPESALRLRLARPCAPGPPRSPLLAALRLALLTAAR